MCVAGFSSRARPGDQAPQVRWQGQALLAARMHARMQICKAHAQVCTHIHARMHARMHTCKHTRMRARALPSALLRTRARVPSNPRGRCVGDVGPMRDFGYQLDDRNPRMLMPNDQNVGPRRSGRHAELCTRAARTKGYTRACTHAHAQACMCRWAQAYVCTPTRARVGAPHASRVEGGDGWLDGEIRQPAPLVQMTAGWASKWVSPPTGLAPFITSKIHMSVVTGSMVL